MPRPDTLREHAREQNRIMNGPRHKIKWTLILLAVALVGVLLVTTLLVFPAPSSVSPPPIAPQVSFTVTVAPSITPQPTANVAPDEDFAMLSVLRQISPPEYDPAMILAMVDSRSITNASGGDEPIPNAGDTTKPAPDWRIGGHSQFWVQNVDTSTWARIDAMLVAAGEHALFWSEVQNGQPLIDPDDAQKIVDEFDATIYPGSHRRFGSEAMPGVDGDPRVYILYTAHTGESAAGYFSHVDAYPPSVLSHSNAHEMFYVNPDALPQALTVLTHEFQHMIHWAHDRSEAGFINEGLSELNVYLTWDNYYYGFSTYYLGAPDIALTFWPDRQKSPGAPVPAYYGGSYLFALYLYGRYGEDLVAQLVANPQDGMAGLNDALHASGYADDADTVFFDWTLSNALLGVTPSASAGGKMPNFYAYPADAEFLHNMHPPHRENISCVLPTQTFEREVHQYGADYYELNCPPGATVTFRGVPTVPVVKADMLGGMSAWSGRGNYIAPYMERVFNLDGLKQATLEFDIRVDAEANYDYGYVMASVDGEMWHVLRGNHMSSRDGDSGYGPGYTGQSDGWVHERIDLSEYAGESALHVRFVYITDIAVNDSGLLIDNIRIPELGYEDDFETAADCEDWEMNGFVCLHNELPQKYSVAVLHIGTDVTVTVQRQTVIGSDAPITFTIPEGAGNNVLVVVAETPFSEAYAPYDFTIRAP